MEEREEDRKRPSRKRAVRVLQNSVILHNRVNEKRSVDTDFIRGLQAIYNIPIIKH